MAQEIESKSNPATTLIGIVVGLGLLFAGSFLYLNKTFHAVEEPLASAGIPLSLGKAIAVIGAFLILFPVVNTFFLKPLKEAIFDRTRELERTFAEAEDLRAEMAKMKSEYESQLKATQEETREKIQVEIRKAQELGESLRAKAVRENEVAMAKFQEDLAREKDRLMNELRVEVVTLTLGATEKILAANVDDDKNRRLIEEFIEKAEVPKG